MIRIEHWGLTPYLEAQTRQLDLVNNIAEGADDTLVFCSHPPVVTVGRGTKPEDIFGWSGELAETSRGGRATYHGPNQIVIYPILNLQREGRANLPARDLHGYLRLLESAIVNSLAEFNLAAEAREMKLTADGPSLTGVWVGTKKIASIGIAVKKWVSYHGVAVNVFNDPKAFAGINPCGFSSAIMTSIEAELDRAVSGEEVRKVLERNFASKLAIAEPSIRLY